MEPFNNYTFEAHCNRVIDGDTAEFEIDVIVELPFNDYLVLKKTHSVRFAGINCPEKKGETKEAGLAAMQYTADRIAGKMVTLRTEKVGSGFEEKYGRYVGHIYIDGVYLNQELVETGHAVYKKY
jgi:micrococcal nuclease